MPASEIIADIQQQLDRGSLSIRDARAAIQQAWFDAEEVDKEDLKHYLDTLRTDGPVDPLTSKLNEVVGEGARAAGRGDWTRTVELAREALGLASPARMQMAGERVANVIRPALDAGAQRWASDIFAIVGEVPPEASGPALVELRRRAADIQAEQIVRYAGDQADENWAQSVALADAVLRRSMQPDRERLMERFQALLLPAQMSSGAAWRDLARRAVDSIAPEQHGPLLEALARLLESAPPSANGVGTDEPIAAARAEDWIAEQPPGADAYGGRLDPEPPALDEDDDVGPVQAIAPDDPWALYRAATARGDIAQARFHLTRVGPDHPHARDRDQLLHGLDDQLLQSNPELADIPGQLASGVRRRAWTMVEEAWTRASLITRPGAPPIAIQRAYQQAMEARDADTIVADQAIPARRRGEFDEAMQLIERALIAEPDNARALNERMRITRARALYDQAIALRYQASPPNTSLVEIAAKAEELGRLVPTEEVGSLRGWLSDQVRMRQQQLFADIRSERANIEAKDKLEDKLGVCVRLLGVDLDVAVEPEAQPAANPPALGLFDQLRALGTFADADLPHLTLEVRQARNRFENALRLREAADRQLAGEVRVEAAAQIADQLTKVSEVAPRDPATRDLLSQLTGVLADNVVELTTPQADANDAELLRTALELVELMAGLPGGDRNEIIRSARRRVRLRVVDAAVAQLDKAGDLLDEAATAAFSERSARRAGLALRIKGALLAARKVSEFADEQAARLPGLLEDAAYGQLKDQIETRGRQYLRRLLELRPIDAPLIEQGRTLGDDLLANRRRFSRADEQVRAVTQLLETARRALRQRMITERLVRLGRVVAFVAVLIAALALLVRAFLVYLPEQAEQATRVFQPIPTPIPTATPVVVPTSTAIPATPTPTVWIIQPEQPIPSALKDCTFVVRFNVCNDAPRMFKTYYDQQEARAWLGEPITPALQDEQFYVQYFQFGRLEFHPENTDAYRYQYGLLGNAVADVVRKSDPDLDQALASVAAGTNPAATYFNETKHSIDARFQRYWQANGDYNTLGFPISEAYEHAGMTVQYFQRARLEIAGNDGPVNRAPIGEEYLDKVKRAVRR